MYRAPYHTLWWGGIKVKLHLAAQPAHLGFHALEHLQGILPPAQLAIHIDEGVVGHLQAMLTCLQLSQSLAVTGLVTSVRAAAVPPVRPLRDVAEQRIVYSSDSPKT